LKPNSTLPTNNISATIFSACFLFLPSGAFDRKHASAHLRLLGGLTRRNRGAFLVPNTSHLPAKRTLAEARVPFGSSSRRRAARADFLPSSKFCILIFNATAGTPLVRSRSSDEMRPSAGASHPLDASSRSR